MKFSSKIKVKDVIDELKKISSDVVPVINDVVLESAIKIEKTAIKKIHTGAATGHTYTRGNITHHASSPGQYPKTDTGELAGSIRTIPGAVDLNGLQSQVVGTPLEYGAWLEYGTLKMEARPWLAPTAKMLELSHKNRLARAINKVINNVSG